jgi:hypothetical protein
MSKGIEEDVRGVAVDLVRSIEKSGGAPKKEELQNYIKYQEEQGIIIDANDYDGRIKLII